MEFSIKTKTLEKGLLRVHGILEKKSSLAILSNVLLISEDNNLKIVATNLEVGIIGNYPSEVISSGSITINGKYLLDIVRVLRNYETINLKLSEDDRMILTSGSSKYNIPTLPAEDFPKLPTFDEEVTSLYSNELLIKLIDKTIYAASHDESKYNLNGVFFQTSDENSITAASTNSHRLAVYSTHLEDGSENAIFNGIIIPRKGLAEIRKILDENDEQVKISYSANHCIFKKTDLTVNIRLIDAAFPDYKQVVDQNYEVEVEVNRLRFIDSIRRVSLTSSSKEHLVKLHFINELLKLSSQDLDHGEAEDSFEISYEGEELTFGFNSNYFIDALNNFSEEVVKIKISKENKPIIITSIKNDDYICVIMPMRL